MSAFDIALRQIDALILSAEASAGPALQPKAAPPQKNDEAGEAGTRSTKPLGQSLR